MNHNFVKRTLAAGLLVGTVNVAEARPGVVPAPAMTGDNPVVRVQQKISREQVKQIRRRLVERGFRHLSIVKRRLPVVAEACRDGELTELRLDRNGKIRNRKVVGQCGRSKRFGFGTSFPAKLRKRGYRRITPIFDGRKKTVFEACKQGKVHAIIVNLDGTIRRELERKRRCAPRRVAKGGKALAKGGIRNILEKRRYHSVRVIDGQGAVAIVEACRRNRRFRVRFDRSSRKVVGRKRVGWCETGGRKFAAAPAPTTFKLDSDKRIGAGQCQDAFEYLLDKDKVYFETASAEIGRRSEPLLKRVARIAKRCPGSTLVIGGHTDSVGSDSSNQLLSEDRALSVVRYLRRRGISGERVSGTGYGESRPVASNSNEQGRSLNRRIEILVEWDG